MKGLRLCSATTSLAEAESTRKELTWFMKGLRPLNGCARIAPHLSPGRNWPDLWRDYDPLIPYSLRESASLEGIDLIYEGITTGLRMPFAFVTATIWEGIDLIYEGITTYLLSPSILWLAQGRNWPDLWRDYDPHEWSFHPGYIEGIDLIYEGITTFCCLRYADNLPWKELTWFMKGLRPQYIGK